MHPLLFKLGPIPIHTYGLAVACGFFLGIRLMRRLALRENLPTEKVIDFAFYGLLVGFLGARLLFVVTQPWIFFEDPAAIFRVWEGGFVFFGALVILVPFSFWYFKKHSLPVARTFDAVMPGISLGHMFGRLGCLGSGCCYGRPTEGGWGIRFYSEITPLIDPHLTGIPLHPTQIYEAIALGALTLGLLWISKKKIFDGQVALTYFMAYPILRSVVEVFRGDIQRGFIVEPWLSTSQFISLVVFCSAGGVLIYLIHRAQKGGRNG